MSLMTPRLPNSAWLLSCSSFCLKRQKSSTAGFRMSRVFRGASKWCSLAVWRGRGIITGLQACKSQLERRLASCLAVWPPVCGSGHTLHIFVRLAVLIGQLWMDWHKRISNKANKLWKNAVWYVGRSCHLITPIKCLKSHKSLCRGKCYQPTDWRTNLATHRGRC